MSLHQPRLPASTRALVLMLSLAFLPVGLRTIRAADPGTPDCAAGEVPADAAFYVGLLRNREQLAAVTSSKAWAKLTALPGLQLAWQAARAQLDTPGGPAEQWRQWALAPENREFLDLLTDMVSEEVFIYGGGSVARVGDVYGRVISGVQMEGFRRGIEETRTGKKAPEVSEEEIVRAVLNELSKMPDALQVPELVIGFKVTNTKRAAAQLKRLEKLLRPALDEVPQFKGRLKREKRAGGDFISLTLDSEAAKFEEQTIRKFEQKPGQYDAVVRRVKALRGTISIGVRGRYLLLSLRGADDLVAQPRPGERLTDLPEWKPLARFADRRLTFIAYVSKAFRSQSGSSFVGMWIEAAQQALPKSDLKPEVRARIAKDLKALRKDLGGAESQPGAALAFSFLTSRGKEGYAYDWTKDPSADGSRPLTILDHVGGDPLVVVAGRSRYSPEAWPRLVHWVKVAYGYFEEFGMSELKPEERKLFREFMEAARPFLRRFDEVTGTMFLPSLLADGQQAFVLDAKLASKHWVASTPALDKPVTIPEPALVYGVSDAALLRKAMAEYRSLLKDTLAAAQKVSPKEVPPFEVPSHQSRKIKGGTMFFYELPAAWGLDERLVPNVALARDVVALTISREHSERLLASTPFQPPGGALPDLKRPLAGAMYIHWAGLTGLVAGWADAAGQFLPKEVKQSEEAVQSVHTFFEFLGVLRSYASATYLEDGAQVTHTELVFKDLQ